MENKYQWIFNRMDLRIQMIKESDGEHNPMDKRIQWIIESIGYI